MKTAPRKTLQFAAAAVMAASASLAAMAQDDGRYSSCDGMEGPQVKITGLARTSLTQGDNAGRTWKNVSPGFVNVPMNVKVDGETISILVDIGGMFQSSDGGRSWRHLTYNDQSGIDCWEFWDFDINPADKGNILIAGQRLYRSADGGASWKPVVEGVPAPFHHAARGEDFAQVKFNCDGSRAFAALGTDKLRPRRNAGKSQPSKAVFISSDKGVSFNRVELGEGFSRAKRIFPHPSKPETVLVSFEDGSLLLCENAKAQEPAFRSVKLPDGYFARELCVDEKDLDLYYAVLVPKSPKGEDGKPSFSMLASFRSGAGELQARQVPLKDEIGCEIKEPKLVSAGFNPRKPGQFVLGVGETGYLLISDDRLASFRKRPLPAELYCDGKLGHFYGQVESIAFGPSPHAVLSSRIGVWISDDNFETIRNLTMRYEGGLFGNYGVGMPANINSMALTKGHLIFCAQDHGLWSAERPDCSKWKILSSKSDEAKFPAQPAPWGGSYTWLHMVQRVFASYDERFLYIGCNAMMKKKFKHDFLAEKKIFLSSDLGGSWTDVTARLGRGDVYPEGSLLLKTLFDPRNSARHWILFSDALFRTEDGGKTFARVESPLFKDVGEASQEFFSDIAFDPAHGTLYLALAPDRLKGKPLNREGGLAALYESADAGRSWKVRDIGQNAVKSVGVTASGTLVVGTQRSGAQPARLISIPYGMKYDPSMIKLTVGDTPEEMTANQLSIGPVICDGEDVLAYSNIEWLHSDRFFCQGPLLSRDGGKSFQWIHADLPNNNIWSAEMRDGNALLGTTSGLMRWQYK